MCTLCRPFTHCLRITLFALNFCLIDEHDQRVVSEQFADYYLWRVIQNYVKTSQSRRRCFKLSRSNLTSGVDSVTADAVTSMFYT